jgi:hypothetical protein
MLTLTRPAASVSPHGARLPPSYGRLNMQALMSTYL